MGVQGCIRKAIIFKGKQLKSFRGLLRRTKWDATELGMSWKSWAVHIFWAEPTPYFPHVGSYCSLVRGNGTELGWEKAEISFTEGQSSIFSRLSTTGT